MAVAFDAFSSVAEGTGTLSWTHTPVGTPKGVRVDIVENGGTNGISACTYGGVALELVAVNAKASGEAGTVVTYFLGRNIPAGAQTVSVTVADAVAKRAAAITVTAATDTCWFAADISIGSDSLANPASTLALGGKTCFVSLAGHSGQNAATGITPSTGWTSRLEHDFGNQTAAWYTYNTISTSNVACGWTQTADDAVMVALAITEAPLATDSNAVGLTESASKTVVFDSRALPILLIESAAITVALSASDTVSVQAQELPAISGAFSASDSAAVQASEVGAALFTSSLSISVTDSLAVQSSDASRTIVSTSLVVDTCASGASDTRATVLTDTGALVVEAHDTATLQATESVNDLLVFIPGSVQNFVVSDSLKVQLNGSGIAQVVGESLTVGVGEAASWIVLVAVTDSTAIGVSEASTLATDTFFTPAINDTAVVGATEAASVLAYTVLAVSDTATVQVPEDVPDVATVITGNDTIVAGLFEPSDQATQFGVLDSAAVQANGEVSQISGLLMFAVSDSVAVQVSGVATIGTVTVKAADSIAVQVTEVLTNSGSVGAVESVRCAVSESVTQSKQLAVADSLGVTASESAFPIFNNFLDLSTTDTCAVQAVDTVSQLISFLLQITTSDSCAVQAVGTAGDQAVTVSSADSLSVQAAAIPDILAVGSVSENMAVSFTEAGLAIPIVTVSVSTFADDAISGFSDAATLTEQDQNSSDAVVAQIGESSSAFVGQPSAETVAAILLEELRLDLSGLLQESGTCGLVETAKIVVTQAVSDDEAVQVDESWTLVPGYYTDDACLVAVGESVSREVVANASPSTWNGNAGVEHRHEQVHPWKYRLTEQREW